MGEAGSKTEADKKEIATRTVMAMATEMADMKLKFNQTCVLFAALATTLGVKTDLENMIF